MLEMVHSITYLCHANIQINTHLLQFGLSLRCQSETYREKRPILIKLDLALLVFPFWLRAFVPYFQSASPIVPLILLKCVLNHYNRPMNKAPVCTNKIVFSKVMTWRKTAINTFNLQSINGTRLPVLLCARSFCILMSLFPPLISPSVPLQSIVVVIVLIPNRPSSSSNHFHSINTEHIFCVNYSHFALFASLPLLRSPSTATH